MLIPVFKNCLLVMCIMRWKAEDRPKVGDIRKVTAFAFCPTTLSNKDVVWLERYTKVQVYRQEWVGFPFGYNYEWVTVERRDMPEEWNRND